MKTWNAEVFFCVRKIKEYRTRKIYFMSFKYLLLHKNILINITKVFEYLDY